MTCKGFLEVVSTIQAGIDIGYRQHDTPFSPFRSFI